MYFHWKHKFNKTTYILFEYLCETYFIFSENIIRDYFWFYESITIAEKKHAHLLIKFGLHRPNTQWYSKKPTDEKHKELYKYFRTNFQHTCSFKIIYFFFERLKYTVKRQHFLRLGMTSFLSRYICNGIFFNIKIQHMVFMKNRYHEKSIP